MTAWPEPVCENCGGYGEVFTHAEDCHDDFCALAGGINDCLGLVVECPSCAPLPTPPAQAGEGQ